MNLKTQSLLEEAYNNIPKGTVNVPANGPTADTELAEDESENNIESLYTKYTSTIYNTLQQLKVLMENPGYNELLTKYPESELPNGGILYGDYKTFVEDLPNAT